MIRGNKLNTTAIMAISAAILCSSPASFAQETAPVPTVQPAAPAPVSPPPVAQTMPEAAPSAATVAPPPAVRTLPDSQLGQPVAASPQPRVAAERSATRRAAARPAPAPRAVEVAPVATSAEDASSATDFSPVNEEAAPVDIVEDTGVIAPIEQPATTELADGTQDDWLIYGGLAAALGLAGLGGVIASRRRRMPKSDYRPVGQTVPAPVNDYPVVRPVMAEKVAPRIIQPRAVDQNLPPVTDPLFAEHVTLGPITDPLFSQKIDLPPVTDPMFADNEDYVGGSTAGSDFDKRRRWPAAPARELEPAE